MIEYYLRRCYANYELLEKFNLIGRTSEFARLYGIEFESVLNRGTQYRVESMMLRLAKPSNYIAVSPGVQQRARWVWQWVWLRESISQSMMVLFFCCRMAAPECIPLVLEPESRFYADPVLVLDFQSLYPSIVIAYNYCFSTCLGRVWNLAQYVVRIPCHSSVIVLIQKWTVQFRNQPSEYPQQNPQGNNSDHMMLV